MTIRILAGDDQAEYSALLTQAHTQHSDCFRSSPSDAQEPAQVGETTEHFTLGAFSDMGHLVGIVSFARDAREKMRHKGLLFRMYVARGVAGQGIGRRLVREIVSRAQALPGLETITLTVVASNTAARYLYASEGFTAFSLEPRALKMGDTYSDEEQMRLELPRVE